jgi:hypothetical protein
MTERQKMLAGELYDPFDPELVEERQRTRDLCQNLNATRESQQTSDEKYSSLYSAEAARRFGCSRPSTATMDGTSIWANEFSSISIVLF